MDLIQDDESFCAARLSSHRWDTKIDLMGAICSQRIKHNPFWRRRRACNRWHDFHWWNKGLRGLHQRRAKERLCTGSHWQTVEKGFGETLGQRSATKCSKLLVSHKFVNSISPTDTLYSMEMTWNGTECHSFAFLEVKSLENPELV